MGKRLAISLAMLLAASACSRGDRVKDGVATDEGIATIALPEEQYRGMLKRSILGTMTGPLAIAKLGLDRGCQALDAAVDKAVEKGLPAWRANLIAAYRDNVPAERLAEAVEESPRRARSILQPHLGAIGTSMKNSSELLLKDSSVEVLAAMDDAASKVDPASIDMQARERDLAQIKATREMCGVKQWQQR